MTNDENRVVRCARPMPFVPPGALERLAARRIAIVGAGPTGLGAAYRLAELGLQDFIVLEREAYAGGLAASFTDAQGFTWDVGGHVQFSHYEYFDRAVDHALRGEWLSHERESWVWIRERFVPYPFQNNIHFLPEPEKRACLLGLVRLRKAAPAGISTFEDWIRARFGDGIAEIFMLPYNAKVWAYPPSDLGYGWVGERVAEVDFERVIVNMLDNRADVGWGPNNTFRFPARGGTGEIWRRIAAALAEGSIRHGSAVTGIDGARRVIRLADGSSEPYDILLFTMPLDHLARLAGVSGVPASSLKYSTVHVFGIGLSGTAPPQLAKKCWMYFPEGTAPSTA